MFSFKEPPYASPNVRQSLVLLGPIIVNIFLYHLLMAPAGLLPTLVALVLWLVVFYKVRLAFSGVFAMREESPNGTRI